MNTTMAIMSKEVLKMSYMQEWYQICLAFCKKKVYELLFVNMDNFGYSDRDGNLYHVYADELAEMLGIAN